MAMLYHDHPAKGALAGIYALEHVKNRVPELELVLFGTPERTDDVPDWATYVRSPSRAALVSEVYSSASIFVQPSIYEGFGYTAVEAMACGTALVATTGGALPEVVGPDGGAGLLVPTADPDAIAGAVARLLDDGDLRARLGTDGERGAGSPAGHQHHRRA